MPTTCHSKDSGPLKGLYLCRIVLSDDPGPDLSFDKSASLESLFSLACVSLVEDSRLDLSFGWSKGDYTSSCPPSLDSAKLASLEERILFNCMANVRQMSAHVIKLRDMPEGVFVLSGLSRVWKSRVCDPVLQGADGNVMGIHDFLCLSEWTSSEVREEPHHDTWPTLEPCNSDDEGDGDDDSCVEIPLVTPLHFAAVIPPSGNQGESSAAEGSNSRDSRGKGIMVDDVVAPSVGASRPRPSSRPAPSFRNVSEDAIHADFFPFLLVLIMPPIPKVVWLGIASLLMRSGMLHTGLLSGALHCMMMSHGGELLARYRGLNQSHHEYVLSADSRLKGYEEKSKAKGKERKKKIKSLTKSLDNLHTKVARLSAALNQATVLEAEKDEEILWLKATPLEFSSFFRGQFQGLVWKFLASDEFSRVQGELLSLDASAGFERELSMHRTKDEFADVLKKMANFRTQTDYAFLNKISEHATEPLSGCSCFFSYHKGVNCDTCFQILGVVSYIDLTASTVASEHNEEMGISIALEDAVELVEVGSGHASFDPNDVVVALSTGEKGDGLVPSSVVGEEAAANSFGV
ncbi:hypothetical protein Tco_1164446 [Tanacetum coccineum]